MSFAIPENEDYIDLNNKKVATSYPNIVNNYFKENSINVSVVDIHGSVELTISHIGISDCICDLVSSGH